VPLLYSGSKVRPLLNVSKPSGLSFNDNVDKHSVERVSMDTARSFSYELLRAGRNARMDKSDVKDVFKNMPARNDELWLQGFMVGNRYFIELRMIFGARTALAQYDILGNTVEKLAITDSGIPRHFVCRAVDDQPVATPGNSTWGEKFVSSYKKIGRELNIELADDCEDCDKAFTNAKCGKVLGVWFDSSNLTWKLPEEKTLATRLLLRDIVSKKIVCLDEMQSLLGRLNFVCMMGTVPPQWGHFPPQWGQIPPQWGHPLPNGDNPSPMGTVPSPMGTYPPQWGQSPPQWGRPLPNGDSPSPMGTAPSPMGTTPPQWGQVPLHPCNM
jgi:hypothetical protein